MNTESGSQTVRAIRAHRRGGPEVLVYERTPPPRLEAGRVLVAVEAASITPTEFAWDSSWVDRNGQNRLPVVPSHEFSGTVVAVARDVHDVAIGDAVFGLVDFYEDGAAAGLTAVRPSDIAPKPDGVSFVDAAAASLSALAAWQALFDHARLTAGQSVLIHGGAGGVGSFAVQLARHAGARVAATASRRTAELVHGLGADRVIDYWTERFEDLVDNCDVVLDTVGGSTLERSTNIVRPGGTLVSVAEPPPEAAARKAGIRAAFFIVRPDRGQLSALADLLVTGELRTRIAGVLPLERGREAYELARDSHRGKVVLDVTGRSSAA
jgi:NADPH:quinone reductase-like Zn-dependent oxidoreductase